MKKKRHSAEDQKGRIIDAAFALIESGGLSAVSWSSLGRKLNVTHSAVMHHYGARPQLIRAVIRKAIQQEKLIVIGKALADGDKTATRAPNELKQRAKEALFA